MEKKLIDWCVNNGYSFVDYFVTRGGKIRFAATRKGKNNIWFEVKSFTPFVRVQKIV